MRTKLASRICPDCDTVSQDLLCPHCRDYGVRVLTASCEEAAEEGRTARRVEWAVDAAKEAKD